MADLNKLRRVTPVLVAEVLKVQTDPVICSKFFHWAGKQKGYYHDFASYNAFAYCLNRSNQFRAADQVPDQRKYFWAIFFFIFLVVFFLGFKSNF